MECPIHLLSLQEDQALMASIFALPKSYLSMPIVQSELTYLNQIGKIDNRCIQRLSSAFRILACCAATLPLWLYMDDQIRTYVLILVMGLTIYLVHLQAA